MQTTLRIDDNLYRLAKIEAAREGITLGRFIEEALTLRLQSPPSSAPVDLPTFGNGPKLPDDFDLCKTIKRADELQTVEQARRLTGKRA